MSKRLTSALPLKTSGAGRWRVPRHPAAAATGLGGYPCHSKNWLSTVPETRLTTTRSRDGTLDAQIAGADIEPVAAPVLLDLKSPPTATDGPNQPAGTPAGAPFPGNCRFQPPQAGGGMTPDTCSSNVATCRGMLMR